MEVTAKDGKIVPKGEKKPEKKDPLLKKKRGRPPKKKEEPKVVITEETYDDKEEPVAEEAKIEKPKSLLPQRDSSGSYAPMPGVFKNTQETETIFFKGASETEKSPRDPQDVKPEYARVSVTVGFTKNLGNYESVKISLSADEFCEPDKKRDTWDRLMGEAKEKLQDYLKEADSIAAEKKAEEAVTTNIAGAEAMRPATQQTKMILNQHMKDQVQYGFDYDSAVKVLRECKTLTEMEARQVISQVSRKDWSFFEQKIEEDSGSEKEDGDLDFGVIIDPECS